MTWGKILVGILAAMCLLAVGALEVVSERRSSSHVYSDRVGEVRPETWDTGVAEPVFTPDLDSPVVRPAPRMILPPRRLTVLEVDEEAGRLVSLTRSGRLHVIDLGRDPFVVSHERVRWPVTLLKPGDVVQIEAADGQAQRIVLLRHGGRELEAAEK